MGWWAIFNKNAYPKHILYNIEVNASKIMGYARLLKDLEDKLSPNSTDLLCRIEDMIKKDAERIKSMAIMLKKRC